MLTEPSTSDDPARAQVSDRPLRIWQICESYPPKYGGGAGIIARDISQALSRGGHDVRVLTTESRPDAADYSVRAERDNGVLIERMSLRYLVEQDPDGWQLGLRRWLRHERTVARFIEQRIAGWRPDIVQYHTTRPLGEAAPRVIARHGIQIVAMLHEAWFICGRLMLLRSPTSEPCSGPGAIKCLECMYSNYDGSHARAAVKLTWRIPRLGVYPAYRLWRRRAARRSLTAAIGYSHFMIDVHRPRLRGEALYVPFGINLSGLPETLPARPRTPLRFGFFGGFQPNKGIWHVLDAAAALKREGLEFELYIWGPGGESEMRAISARGLDDRVRLKGMYGADEMWDAYCEVDVALMATTVSEPFGRVPIEARAAGAPTIAPAIGGLRESIRDGVDGLLYRFGDCEALERQMRRVIAEPGLFAELCAGLQPVIDTRTRGAALETVYRSILAGAAAEAA
jgi:glycosyltransferase involved in cell wall biosynthesis